MRVFTRKITILFRENNRNFNYKIIYQIIKKPQLRRHFRLFSFRLTPKIKLENLLT